MVFWLISQNFIFFADVCLFLVEKRCLFLLSGFLLFVCGSKQGVYLLLFSLLLTPLEAVSCGFVCVKTTFSILVVCCVVEHFPERFLCLLRVVLESACPSQRFRSSYTPGNSTASLSA